MLSEHPNASIEVMQPLAFEIGKTCRNKLNKLWDLEPVFNMLNS